MDDLDGFGVLPTRDYCIASSREENFLASNSQLDPISIGEFALGSTQACLSGG